MTKSTRAAKYLLVVIVAPVLVCLSSFAQLKDPCCGLAGMENPASVQPPAEPAKEPPKEPASPLSFRAASGPLVFPGFAAFSPGLAPDVWLDWSAEARAKNRPLERLSLAAGKVVWLPRLAGDDKLLAVKFRQGSKELDPATLALDLRPDFVLEHPLGLFVLAQGFLFQFQTAEAGIPWGVKQCLVRRIDSGGEALAGSLRLAPDGGLWLLLKGGPATLAGTLGRPVQVAPGESLWKIDPEGRSLELRAHGPAGALDQLVNGPNGTFYLKMAQKDLAAGEARSGYRPLSSLEFLQVANPTAVRNQEVGRHLRESIVWRAGKEGRPDQFLLVEAEAISGRIFVQMLDRESSALFATGEKFSLTQGLPEPVLLALGDGTLALFSKNQPGTANDEPWLLKGFAVDSSLKAASVDPGASVAKLGPVPLSNMVGSAQSLEAWRAWAEARGRIQKRMNALNPVPPPLMAQLQQQTQSDEITESALIKIVSLLEVCGDAKSIKAIQELAEDSAVPVRVQCLEALGRLARPDAQIGDQAIYQTMLNGMADPEPLIKSAAALALGRSRFPGSANALATALSFDTEPEGDWQKLLGYALRLLETPGHDRVWQMAQSGQGADLEKAAAYFASTSERSAGAFILQLLDYPHLAPRQRRVLLKALRPEGDENLGRLIGKRIVQKEEKIELEELALWWEKGEETPWAASSLARDRLLELLRSENEEVRWFALGKWKKQVFAGASDLLEKGRAAFPLSEAQKRALEEAIRFQKGSKENQENK